MRLSFSRPLVAPVHPVVRLQRDLPRPLPQQPKKSAKDNSAADTSVTKRFIAEA